MSKLNKIFPLRIHTLVIGVLFICAASLAAHDNQSGAEEGSLAVSLNFDDCGVIFENSEGCMLFYADNHYGVYTLDNYGAFISGDRVHVHGSHNPVYSCSCKSSCIKENTISAGCSVTCSGIIGDVDNNSSSDIGDVVALICVIFHGCDFPICVEQADCDGSGVIEITDLICLLTR